MYARCRTLKKEAHICNRVIVHHHRYPVNPSQSRTISPIHVVCVRFTPHIILYCIGLFGMSKQHANKGWLISETSRQCILVFTHGAIHWYSGEPAVELRCAVLDLLVCNTYDTAPHICRQNCNILQPINGKSKKHAISNTRFDNRRTWSLLKSENMSTTKRWIYL